MIRKSIFIFLVSVISLSGWSQASGYKGKTQYASYSVELGHQNTFVGLLWDYYPKDNHGMRWPVTHSLQYHKIINRVNEITIGVGFGRNTRDSSSNADDFYNMFNQMASSISTQYVRFQDIRLSVGYRKYTSGSSLVSLAPLHMYFEGKIDLVRVSESVIIRDWEMASTNTFKEIRYNYNGSSLYVTPVLEMGYQTVISDQFTAAMGVCFRAPLRVTSSPYPDEVRSTRGRSSVYIYHAYPEFIRAKFSVGYLF
jgi:hypothetical protein